MNRGLDKGKMGNMEDGRGRERLLIIYRRVQRAGKEIKISTNSACPTKVVPFREANSEYSKSLSCKNIP